MLRPCVFPTIRFRWGLRLVIRMPTGWSSGRDLLPNRSGNPLGCLVVVRPGALGLRPRTAQLGPQLLLLRRDLGTGLRHRRGDDLLVAAHRP